MSRFGDSTALRTTDEEVHHLETTPVFVIGHARSGTSILTASIRKHLHIAFGTESQFIVRLASQFRKCGDLRDPVSRRRFVEALAAERFFVRTERNYGFALDKGAVLRDTAEGTYRSILDSVFGQLAAHMRYPRWGDKTPEYAHHLPVLYSLYPEARFIHVVRDGRDVGLSTLETHFGAKNVHAAAVDWLRCMEAVDRFQAGHPAAAFINVRYEDLLREPARVFRSLVEFLRIADGDALVRRIEPRLRAELRSGNTEKWRSRLSTSEQRRFEGIAGTMLERYGYDRVAPNASAPGHVARTYWAVDNLLRRATTIGYWRDNLYRLKLRLGS